jgi:hypothetical protein
MEVQTRLIEKLVFNTRNPRRNDKTVDRVYGEVGLKIPYLARSGTRRKSEGGGRGTNRAGRRSRRAIRSGAGGRKEAATNQNRRRRICWTSTPRN